jgi:hypothetical protein
MEDVAQVIDFTKYKNVFCDSIEALDLAYKQGLPHDAVIRTSSPAMLWHDKPNIKHVEVRWSVEEMSIFQTTIQRFSEEIYGASMKVSGVSHEEALCIAQTAVRFQRVLFKAACLEENDFIEPRLILRVEGEGGPGGNNMNTPWGKLLSINSKLLVYDVILQNDSWNTLTVDGVSWWDRIKLGGLETIIYRLATRFERYIPANFFSREVLIPSENELVIETAAALLLRGVWIRKISPSNIGNKDIDTHDRNLLFNALRPIMYSRIRRWVTPAGIKSCENMFINELSIHLQQFDKLIAQWNPVLKENNNKTSVVLTNSPGNVKGQALASVCNILNIPIVSVQHGITIEISAFHGEVSTDLDDTVSDLALVYNRMSSKFKGKSPFSKAKFYVVGASSRHLRMKNCVHINSENIAPIVYISTNLYRGNLGQFVSWLTDYSSAKREQKIVIDVLNKLPHKLRYKTYPADNKRYADTDPVFGDVLRCNNIELFDKKNDMRYLFSGHRVLVTSVATSTLGWLVFTGKPVVFINNSCHGPLNSGAYKSFAKGLFVFDSDKKNFHRDLRRFLSQSINDIERLWQEKEVARKEMIRDYFSTYNGGAGKRAAQIILRECL